MKSRSGRAKLWNFERSDGEDGAHIERLLRSRTGAWAIRACGAGATIRMQSHLQYVHERLGQALQELRTWSQTAGLIMKHTHKQSHPVNSACLIASE